MDEITTNSDGNVDTAAIKEKPPLWGSARLVYTICAFFAMVIHLCLRNTLNFIILCMVKPQPVENSTDYSFNAENSTYGPIDIDYSVNAENSTCGSIDFGNETLIERSGNILWSRSQQFNFLGMFYYGYSLTLPFAGQLADRFGGKLLFVHSLTAQAAIFMLIPFFAHRSYTEAVVIRIIQGLIAGCGNPALYQLFSIWAHPSERSTLLSFAYGGFPVGTLLVFPISSLLCKFGWELAFYIVGSVSLLFGICCQWLVYSTLEDHPRLTKEEYEYLKESNVEKSTTGMPWKSIFTSVPVYAFIFTHICHTYGIMVLTILIPRFFKEAMSFSLDMLGYISAAPFVGAFISKIVTITSCSRIENRPNLNLTRYRRITYVICNCFTIFFLFCIILSNVEQRTMVVLFTVCIGITTDMAFSGVYWPSMLYVAPSYAGLISGLANCVATISGFLAPSGISNIVHHGNKDEWNLVMVTLITSYLLGAISYGFFGSSKLATWGQVTKSKNNINSADATAEVEI